MIEKRSARRRVLHIVRQFHPMRGGLEDVVRNLAFAQAAAGDNVTVLTLDRLFTHPGTRLPAEDRLGPITIKRIPWRGSSRYPFAPGFLKAIGDADIVHVHAIDFFYDALALTAPLHRKPIVVTTHGGFFHTGAHSRLKKLWFQGPTRLSALAYRTVVACSRQDAALFAPVVGKRLAMIENGVDIDKFRDAAAPVAQKHLVSIGRFSVNKHPERLLAVFAELRRRDPSWRMTLIGNESDWSRDALQAEAALHGLGDSVAIRTGLDDAGVREVIGTASLFVSASDYEGFGLSLVEAASAGLGLVVHPNAAFRDFAARESGIRLADFSDPSETASAIEATFATLPAIRKAPRWVAHYDWFWVAARYRAVYAAACGDRPAFVYPRSELVNQKDERRGRLEYVSR